MSLGEATNMLVTVTNQTAGVWQEGSTLKASSQRYLYQTQKMPILQHAGPTSEPLSGANADFSPRTQNSKISAGKCDHRSCR